MTDFEKQEIIYNNKEPTIAAINGYLDKMYYVIEKFSSNQKEIIKDDNDKKIMKFVSSLQDETFIYERLLKMIKNDEDLKLMDINYVMLAYKYSASNLKDQIDVSLKALKMINTIIEELSSEKEKSSV